MSSIYKKGRDGYYYYQTYVINPDSGKKDKRIFHSLGTKDLEEAQKKKTQLDKNYNEATPPINRPNFINKLKFGVPILLIIIYLILPTSNSDFIKEQSPNDKMLKKNIQADLLKKKNVSVDSVNLNNIDTKVDSVKNNQNMTDHERIQKQKMEKLVVVPSYEIIKVEKMPPTFDQVKIYVLVTNNENISSLKILCDKLSKEFSEFSNILICLFNDKMIGENFANGKLEAISSNSLLQAWLGMYTENPVEGSFFDDNPGRYLGGL